MGLMERHEHPGPNNFVIANGATESNWLRMAIDKCQVDFFCALPVLLKEMLCFFRTRENKGSGSIPVEAMHDEHSLA